MPTRTLCSVLLALFAVACAEEQPVTVATVTTERTVGDESHAFYVPPSRPSVSTVAAACPMYAQGARVTYENMHDGAALFFTATDEYDPDLRSRVRNLANWHNANFREGTQTIPAAAATVTIGGGGARVEFRADDSRNIPALRAAVEQQAQIMDDQGTCPTPYTSSTT